MQDAVAAWSLRAPCAGHALGRRAPHRAAFRLGLVGASLPLAPPPPSCPSWAQVYLGNIPYDLDEEVVAEFFGGLQVSSGWGAPMHQRRGAGAARRRAALAGSLLKPGSIGRHPGAHKFIR